MPGLKLIHVGSVSGTKGLSKHYTYYGLSLSALLMELQGSESQRTRLMMKAEVIIASRYGFLPSGNKPLPQPMLTHNCVAVLRHLA